MKKWIRWSGLIPFVVVTALLLVFFYFYADNVVRKIIESTGSDMVGARVDTRSVAVHFVPLGITIRGLQVTNPDSPMQNMVDIDRVQFGMDLGRLLLGKVIIQDMLMDEVSFDTPRKTSGALPKKEEKKPEPKSDAGGFNLPGIELPSPATVLAQEKLKTQILSDELQKSITLAQGNWDKLQASIPTQARLDSHQARYQQIQKTDTHDLRKVAEAIKDLQSLIKDIQGDLDAIQHARDQVGQDLKSLDQQYHALLKAPGEDQKHLQQKYTPDTKGVGNLSGMLFGPKSREWLQQGLVWYEKLAPYISKAKTNEPKRERLKGINVKFREFQPTPDFLISRIRASVTTQAGKFNGEIIDVTHQPEVIHRPLTFVFHGRNMSRMEALDLTGSFNHIDAAKSVDVMNLSFINYHVSETSLSDDPSLTLKMKSARSDTVIKLAQRSGQLDGSMNMHLQDIAYDNKASDGEFQQILVSAFNTMHDFNIDARLEGTLGQPKFNLTSDIDQKLKREVQVAMDKRMEHYRQALDTEIKKATEAQIEQARQQIETLRKGVETQLAAVQKQVDQQRQQIESQRKQYEADIAKQQKQVQQQLQDKAQDLLKQFIH